jgi:hypothetical protein
VLKEKVPAELAKVKAVIESIEERLGHYVKSGSAIPAAAVAGNNVTPSLADEIAAAQASIEAIEAELAAEEKQDDPPAETK